MTSRTVCDALSEVLNRLQYQLIEPLHIKIYNGIKSLKFNYFYLVNGLV